MTVLAYILMFLSLVATVLTVIAAPAIVPMFIVFWVAVLWGGKRLTRKRDAAADEALRRRSSGPMDS